MNIPGFTAQASLYRTSNSYRSLAFDRASPQRTVLVPQLGGPGFVGSSGCITDCMDRLEYYHPELTIKEALRQCGQACRDPVGTPGSGGGYGPLCESSPPASCAIAYWACCHLPGQPFTCAFICPDWYDDCLENSHRECLIARHGPLKGGSSYPAVHGPSLTP
jgi:hypothetical protein